MTNPYPLPREIRESPILIGDGRATYGPFGFRIWDTADVSAVVSRQGGEFMPEEVQAEKTTADPFAFFVVNFAAALLEGDRAIVRSTRLHERQGDVTRGGSIAGTELERELSKQGTTLQELRRDETRNEADILLERIERIRDILAERLARIKGDDDERRARERAIELERNARESADNLERDTRERTDRFLHGLIGDMYAGQTLNPHAVSSTDAIPSLTFSPAVSYLVTAGKSFPGDGGGALWQLATGQPAHPGRVRDASGAWWELARTAFSARAFGARLDGNDDAAALRAACQAAAALGLGEIIIDGPLLAGSTADCQGLALRCSNTVITAKLVNHAGIKGGFINGHRQDVMQREAPEVVSDRPKILRKNNDGTYFVMTAKSGRRHEGTIAHLVSGITTLSSSLGGSADLIKAGYVHNCVGLYAFIDTTANVSGTWTNSTVPETALPHRGTDNNVQRALFATRSGAAGDYRTYNVVVPLDGRMNVAIWGTPASGLVEIIVGGVVVKTVDPRQWDGRVYAVPFDAPPGSRQIIIRQAGAGSIFVVGLCFHAIGDARPDIGYTNWAAYRDPTAPFYVDGNGSHEYAIYDADTRTWGGSFHGGEVASLREFVLDGRKTAHENLPLGYFGCFGAIMLRQATTIDWRPIGGTGLLRVRSITSFRDGQIEMECAFSGNVRASEFLVGIHGVPVNFNHMLFPRDIPNIQSTDPKIFLGHTSKLVMRNPATDALSITDISLYEDGENNWGGAYIHPAENVYLKLYNGPVVEAARPVAQVHSIQRRTFR